MKETWNLFLAFLLVTVMVSIFTAIAFTIMYLVTVIIFTGVVYAVFRLMREEG